MGSTIELLYLHDIASCQEMMLWVADCIKFCDAHCIIFKTLLFDESNFCPGHLQCFCEALQSRPSPLESMRTLSFAWTHRLAEEARVEPGQLFRALNQQCPNLEFLYLNATRMRTLECEAIYDFYVEWLEDHGETPLRNLKQLDLNSNRSIG